MGQAPGKRVTVGLIVAVLAGKFSTCPEIRIAELSAEMESRGIEVADAGDLPVPDLASVPLPDASKILGDEEVIDVIDVDAQDCA